MARLTLIRHAQASIHSEDYDRLSTLGEEQAEVLAADWAGRGERVDAVYLGSLRRHRQTMEPMAHAYRAHGLSWPQPVVLDALGEHQGPEVIARALPTLVESDPGVAAWNRAPAGSEAKTRAYLKAYRRLTLEWVRGRLGSADLEDWPSFRRRVELGLKTIIDQGLALGGRGRRVVAFTSGGPVAATLGWALALGDEKTLEVSWVVQNTAISEFLFSANRFSLRSFNGLPHLGPDLVTDI